MRALELLRFWIKRLTYSGWVGFVISANIFIFIFLLFFAGKVLAAISVIAILLATAQVGVIFQDWSQRRQKEIKQETLLKINVKNNTNFTIENTYGAGNAYGAGRAFTFDPQARKFLFIDWDRPNDSYNRIVDFSYIRGWELNWIERIEKQSLLYTNVVMKLSTTDINTPLIDITIPNKQNGDKLSSILDILINSQENSSTDIKSQPLSNKLDSSLNNNQKINRDILGPNLNAASAFKSSKGLVNVLLDPFVFKKYRIALVGAVLIVAIAASSFVAMVANKAKSFEHIEKPRIVALENSAERSLKLIAIAKKTKKKADLDKAAISSGNTLIALKRAMAESDNPTYLGIDKVTHQGLEVTIGIIERDAGDFIKSNQFKTDKIAEDINMAEEVFTEFLGKSQYQNGEKPSQGIAFRGYDTLHGLKKEEPLLIPMTREQSDKAIKDAIRF